MAQTKQQREMIVLVALAVVGVVVWYGFFGKHRVINGGLFPKNYQQIDVEDYGKPLKDLESTRGTEYKSSGRNIFIAAPPPPPPTTTVTKVEEPKPLVYDQPQPPPPPPKPTLDMKFFGLGTFPAPGPRRAFLQDGDEVRIVGEGDTIKNHIRITHIGNDRIEYEDINTGMKNSTNLEMPPPA